MSVEVITLLGPTATGKTRVAVRLAASTGAEIVSADSRQVYRGMDIGTGKDIGEYLYNGTQIPYHLIDIAEPGTEYNVFQFQKEAHKALNSIADRGKKAVLCGGSGMYVEALLKGYKLFSVPQNDVLRSALASESDEQLSTLLASYRSLHNHTDSCERPRLLRAIEIEEYYLQHPELNETTHPVDSVIFGLCGDRDQIRSNITDRLKERMNNGMIEEVETLIKNGVPPDRLIRYGLEYKFITQYLLGTFDKETLFQKLNTAIHQFSKRQMTWFRKMEKDGFTIHWMDIMLPDDEKIEKMLIIINQKNK